MINTRPTYLLILSHMAYMALAAPCWAQTECDQRPHVKNVAQADKDRAEKLADDGAYLFSKGLFAQAADKFRAAIRLWNHPAFHYNLILALRNMDERPVEAYESLLVVLHCGADDLSADQLHEATRLHRLIARLVTELEVVSKRPGTIVTLDTRPILDQPGRVRKRVKVGEYVLEAHHDQRIDASETLHLDAENLTRVHVDLLESSVVAEHRWPRWVPWVGLGAGVAVAGVAGVLHMRAGDSAAAYREQFAIICPDGCHPEDHAEDLGDLERKAASRYRLATAAWIGSGAVLLTGGVMLYMSRVRYKPNPDEPFRIQHMPRVEVGLGSVSLRGQF